jgi:S-DNA-T family DNA segregation ATPase FtsK/SpoIIIE
MAKKAAKSKSTKSKAPKAKRSKTKPAKPKPAGDGSPPRWWRFLRYGLVLVLAATAALAWVSVLTFHPTDPPAEAVYPPQPARNAAGLAGAYLAYGLLYWLGEGAYMLLLFATLSAGYMLLGGRINDWPWRLVGAALMVTATSVAVHLLHPTPSDGLMEGPGGILGIATGSLMVRMFSTTGSWLILLFVFGLSVMLVADNLVLKLPSFGRKLWKKRGVVAEKVESLRQLRPAPATETANAADPRPKAAVARPERKEEPPPKAKPAEKPAQAKEAAQGVLFPRPAAPKTTGEPPPRPASGDYSLPASELLAEPTGGFQESAEAAAEEKRAVLQKTLDDFNVDAQVVGYMTGPVISLFELSLAPGVKVNRIDSLCRDIARALAVPGVRVVSPLPGRDTVGIEVPNLDKEIVRLKELMALAPDAAEAMQLPLYLGKDAGGGPIVADLAAMPHMLLAGTTGSGKSVCINAIVSAMLMTRTPEQVRLILVDPKMVEMAAFENIPHLLCPIVNDMRKAEDILEWAATKMDERYNLLKDAGVRNIIGYNRLGHEELCRRLGAEGEEEKARIAGHMPYYVIIIDELADLIMTSSKEVEGHIIRIAQKARAVGIHLLLATQRPSVNVVTGLIKSNMPCRISFRVASRQESRIVLDQNGAEVLLGRGDMLMLQPGTSHLVRAQGTYVDDAEVRALVEHVGAAGEPAFHADLMRIHSGQADLEGAERDELFEDAVEIILASKRGSVSLLQRRLQIGYSRASRIVDQMADAGILGDYKGSQARECLMTLDDWRALKESIAADQSGDSAANGEPTSS